MKRSDSLEYDAKARRNEQALVSRLPPEVLSRVFAFNVADEVPMQMRTWGCKSRSSPKLGWIKVTHVCRHWRDVALGDPRLWGEIAFDLGAQWVALMLARSKSAPLVINHALLGMSGAWETQPVGDILTAHLARIAEVDLVLSSGLLTRLDIGRVFSRGAPLLEAVELHISPEYGDTWIDTIAVDDHFSYLAPRLRRITMDGCRFFRHEMPIYPNLTKLEIKLPEHAIATNENDPDAVTDSDRPTFETLVHSLQSMPLLEILALENCFTAHTAPAASSSTIDFIHLASLSLAGRTADCLSLIQRLRMAPAATIRLHCKEVERNGQDCLSLLPFITSHLACRTNSSAPPIRTLNVSHAGGQGLLIRAWDISAPADQDPVFEYHSASPLLMLLFAYDSEDEGVDLHVVQQSCNALPLDELQTLSIDVWAQVITPALQWSSQPWLDMFGKCRRVYHVHATGIPAVHLCVALAEVTPPPGSPSAMELEQENSLHNSYLFPGLKRLSLSHIVLHGVVPGSPRPFYQDLRLWLKKRLKAGADVEYLYLAQCVGDNRFIRDLQGVVPWVFWDDDDYLGVRQVFG